VKKKEQKRLERVKQLNTGIMNELNPHLKKGQTLFLDTYIKDGGHGSFSLSGYVNNKMNDYFYFIEDDIRCCAGLETINELIKPNNTNQLYQDIKSLVCSPRLRYKKIKMQFEKESEIKVDECTPSIILQDINFTLRYEMTKCKAEKIIHTVIYKNNEILKNEVDAHITEELKTDDENTSSETVTAVKDYENLSYALNKEISELEIEVTSDEIKVSADKAFPQWGIGLLKDR